MGIKIIINVRNNKNIKDICKTTPENIETKENMKHSSLKMKIFKRNFYFKEEQKQKLIEYRG